MLKILNTTKAYVGTITDYRDLVIEDDVSTGESKISFYYLGTETIPNEYYIETDEKRYVVKEREPDEDGCSYNAKIDLEELQGTVYSRFTAKNKTLREAAELALNGTAWTVRTSITSKRNVQRYKVNRLETIYAICAAWMCEVSFDNLNRVITFEDTIGADRGVYFIKGLNLRKSGLVSDSYDYVTRLIPYGADGLTIGSVNGGIDYIDNHQYSSKVIAQIWEDTNYTDAEALKEDTIKKLADLSKPKLSYTADVIDLANASPDYGILEFGIGDTIRLIDEATGIVDKQRIVKLKRYPDDPEKNQCEIANTTLTFEELQDKQQKAADAWEDVSNTDGTVNGVYVHGISQENEVIIETIISDSPTIDGIKENALSEVEVLFAQGTSPTVAPDSGWSQQAPAWDSGKYMWQKTTQTKLDGTQATPVATNISGAKGDKGDAGAKGDKGDTGTSVTRTRQMYYLSTSNQSQTDGSWDFVVPQYVAGRYYWTKTVTYLSDGTSTESTPVLDNALTDANSNAYSAVTSANGKNVNIYQESTPGTAGRVVGDTWFKTQTTSGNTSIIGLYKWDGTAWVQQPLNATVIPLLDAGKIVTGILQAIKIQSADGNSYWDLAQNQFVTKNGEFEGTIVAKNSNNSRKVNIDSNGIGVLNEGGTTVVKIGYATSSGTNYGCLLIGTGTVGKDSISAGTNNTASGPDAIAVGANLKATGTCSAAFGTGSEATGTFSAAFGGGTKATGSQSAAFGESTKASGEASAAFGEGTEAKGYAQLAAGRFNVVDNNNDYAFIIGKGDDANNKSNAVTVDWDGNMNVAGNLKSKVTELTLTRSTNSYVDATAFERMHIRKVGNIAVVYGNLQLTADMPKTTGDSIKIGSISGATVVQAGVVLVPASGSGSSVMITINTSNEIRIYNYSNADAKGWIRFSMALIVN